MYVAINDYKGFKIWIRYYVQKIMPQFFYPFLLKYFYKKHLNKNLNINYPFLFSEKLNYLKIYDVTEEKKNLCNRLLAKEFVNSNYPEIKTAKVYDIALSYDELDFSKCPEKFIIKTTHACKSGIIINNKNEISNSDSKKYSKYYKKVLAINYAFWGTLELQYKDIDRKIYIEELLEPQNGTFFNEYEVYCFNGNVEFIHYSVDTNDGLFRHKYLNKNWAETNFGIRYKLKSDYFPALKNRQKVIEYAEKLSRDFKFVRVDFFEVNEELYFAEMTFTPFSGDIKIVPEQYDVLLGTHLKI